MIFALSFSNALFAQEAAEEAEAEVKAVGPGEPEESAVEAGGEVEAEGAAEVETPAAAPEVTFPFEAAVTGENVNLRLEKGTRADIGIIAKIYKGQKVKVLGQEGQWCKVEIPKLTFSWVHKDYVKELGESVGEITGDAVNIRASNDTSSDVIGRLFRGYKVKIVDEEGDWLRIEALPEAVAWISGEYLESGGKALGSGAAPSGEGVAKRIEGHKVLEEEMAEKLKGAEAAYKEILKKDIEEWNFDGPLAVYKEVFEKAVGPGLRTKALEKIAEIASNEDIKKRFLKIREMKQEFQKEIDVIEERYQKRMETLKSTKVPEIPITQGVIQKLYLDYLDPATHKLQNEKGKTIYLIYSEGVDLKPLEGKKVKIFGTIEDSDWGLAIIKVGRAEEVK